MKMHMKMNKTLTRNIIVIIAQKIVMMLVMILFKQA